MIATTPALPAASGPSENGKKASDASAAPFAFSPACSTARVADALDAVHLPGPRCTVCLILDDDNGVGLHMLDSLPREQQIVDLFRGRASAADSRQVLPSGGFVVFRLNEEAAA